VVDSPAGAGGRWTRALGGAHGGARSLGGQEDQGGGIWDLGESVQKQRIFLKKG
jgi:hypothetical protein